MKFSIRDLLFLTTIAAVSAGWWVDHWRLRKQIDHLNEPKPFFGLTPNGTPVPHFSGFNQTGPWPPPTPPAGDIMIHDSYFRVDLGWPLAIAVAALAALAVLGWLVVRFKLISQFGVRELLWLLMLAAILAAWGIDHIALDAERQWLQRMDSLRTDPYARPNLE